MLGDAIDNIIYTKKYVCERRNFLNEKPRKQFVLLLLTSRFACHGGFGFQPVGRKGPRIFYTRMLGSVNGRVFDLLTYWSDNAFQSKI